MIVGWLSLLHSVILVPGRQYNGIKQFRRQYLFGKIAKYIIVSLTIDEEYRRRLGHYIFRYGYTIF